ncbi:hypothetical protein IW136_005010, partial [Coemansia sp. RSA 678]
RAQRRSVSWALTVSSSLPFPWSWAPRASSALFRWAPSQVPLSSRLSRLPPRPWPPTLPPASPTSRAS